MTDFTRRELLKGIGAAPLVASAAAQQDWQSGDGAIVDRTSTSGVYVPPRGRGFQKLSFDFPEPSVVFNGYEFGFRVFTHENTYGLSRPRMTARGAGGGVDVSCTEFVWAGGQQRAPGQLTATLRKDGVSV